MKPFVYSLMFCVSKQAYDMHLMHLLDCKLQHADIVVNICRTRLATAVAAATEAATTVAATSANPTGMDLDCPVDPSEPTYCICKQVSYGEMIACDNPDVCITFLFHIFIPHIFLQISDLLILICNLMTVQDRMVPF